MELYDYADTVYFQFYRKVEEVDYFIREAVSNAIMYVSAPSPKDNALCNKMQFTFSAYVNALVSCWEISKLSIQLNNQLAGQPLREGLVGESKLESTRVHFATFFGSDDNETYECFRFIKTARNANSHDGSLALNSGNEFLFSFGTDLHRYSLSRADVFVQDTFGSPSGDAISCMVNAAMRLAPLFEGKLCRPVITAEQHYKTAEFKFASLKGFPRFPTGVMKQMIQAMCDLQIQGPTKEMTTTEMVDGWRGLWADYFLHVQACRGQAKPV